jgi:uncharacterized protein DUF6893
VTKLLALLAAVGGVGALVYSQMPELRRYMKIKQM